MSFFTLIHIAPFPGEIHYTLLDNRYLAFSTMKQSLCLLCIGLIHCYFIAASIAANNPSKRPELLLAQRYQPGTDVSRYLVSEKFDGIRALWDGKVLRSRAGNIIAAPNWFTKNFPTTPLDGELWLAAGQFEALSSAVRKMMPIDAEWQKISYLVFELPNATGPFTARAEKITNIINQARVRHLKAITQHRVKNTLELDTLLQRVVANGGEGLMLHRADALYVTGRSDVLLKLKPLFDAEATVVGHNVGRGKYTGKLGALWVETSEGIRFKLGTGFSDAQRDNPPPIGSKITYTYRGKTKSGKPKFASFLRVRAE
jgi:DNA ligase 1